MRYRELGKTGLLVSEIGLGAEWLERHTAEEVAEVIHHCEDAGINILDCWMSEPNVRSNIGAGHPRTAGQVDHTGPFGFHLAEWTVCEDTADGSGESSISGFAGSPGTDYIDLGMIHFVDEEAEFHRIMDGEFFAYAAWLKKQA